MKTSLLLTLITCISQPVLRGDWSAIIERQLGENWMTIDVNLAYKANSNWYYLPEADTWIYIANYTPQYPEMTLVQKATFIRGATVDSAYVDQIEKPAHQVTLTHDLMVQVTEVTLAQWEAVRVWAVDNNYPDIATGSAGPVAQGADPNNHPVVDITWYDIVKWLNAYSQMKGFEPCYYSEGTVYREGISHPTWDQTKNGFRLPTEAEWEFACKGRTVTDFYNGSMSEPYCSPLDPVLDLIAAYCGNSNSSSSVGSKYPNQHGLYDTLGSVWEWCWDWGIGDYSSESVIDPVGPAGGVVKIGRGGAWGEEAHVCRSTKRSGLRPENHNILFGFRPFMTKFDPGYIQPTGHMQ
jgi:formylglycine-generating enzyme required for sulfatase activity